MPRIEQLFARHNIRCTKQRRAVYAALEATEMHPTAMDLMDLCARTQLVMSLATVYNTLELLVRKGLARRYTGHEQSGDAARYDADVRSHIHLVDARGLYRDVPADLHKRLLAGLPAEVIEQIEERMGVRIDQIRIELVGEIVAGGAC